MVGGYVETIIIDTCADKGAAVVRYSVILENE